MTRSKSIQSMPNEIIQKKDDEISKLKTVISEKDKQIE